MKRLGAFRMFWRCALGTVVALAVLILGACPAWTAEKVEPITVNINQSPWFDGFRKLVELYETETGNAVKLNVNPYLGSLEASRNSVRASEGFAHLVVVDNNWVVEFYAGGFLTPLTDLDPRFKLEDGVNTYDDTIFWDSRARTFNRKTGKLLGVPINGNVEVVFYREDLYKEKGLKVPDTWDELMANAKALHDPPRRYGIVHYDDRNFVASNFVAYNFSFGGGQPGASHRGPGDRQGRPHRRGDCRLGSGGRSEQIRGRRQGQRRADPQGTHRHPGLPRRSLDRGHSPQHSGLEEAGGPGISEVVPAARRAGEVHGPRRGARALGRGAVRSGQAAQVPIPPGPGGKLQNSQDALPAG
jgi:hypothetical protein